MRPKSPVKYLFASKPRSLLRSCASPASKTVTTVNLTLLCLAFYLFQLYSNNNLAPPAWQPNSPLLTCTHVVPDTLAHFARAPVVEYSTFDMKRIFHPYVDRAIDLHRNQFDDYQDIQLMLELSQKMLRQITGDNSIAVANITVGYSYLDRRYGSRYLAHVKSTTNKSGNRGHHMFLFHNSFNGQCRASVRHYPAHVMKQTVYMIVTYSTRPERLKWFLDQFDLLRYRRQNIQLLLSLCATNESDTSIAMRHVNNMKQAQHVRVLHHKMDVFNKAVCLRETAATITNNSLLFFTDVDMQINRAWFERCRVNALPGIQAYFPKVYNTFPGKDKIGYGRGSWIDGGYGNACMYKFDYDAVEAFKHAETDFVGWGAEDFHMEQVFEKHPSLEVFRAVEPYLIHKWHPKVCEPSLTYYNNCVGTKLNRMGVPAYLAKALEKESIDVQEVVMRDHVL